MEEEFKQGEKSKFKPKAGIEQDDEFDDVDDMEAADEIKTLEQA